MNNLEEFSLEEARDIREKVEYIRINDTAYKGLSYKRMLEVIIAAAIDCDRAEALEAARLIKFNYDGSKYNNMYKGYTYIIPARDNLIIDKAIKVLNVAFGNSNHIRVKFCAKAEDIMADREQEKCTQKFMILQKEKVFVGKQIFDDIKELTDEEIRKEEKELHTKIMDFNQYRFMDLYWQYERRYSHIKWMLNDLKQAELFNVSIEEYQRRFKEANLKEDKDVCAFLEYIKVIQENMNMGFILEEHIYGN